MFWFCLLFWFWFHDYIILNFDLMKTSNQPEICMVSSCLVGLLTRYDGQKKPPAPECMARLKNTVWIPVCPEQLGGLPTPRESADIVGGTGRDVLDGKARVLTKKDNTDCTQEFIRGAEQVLSIARNQNISTVIFKARSPSCGVTSVLGVTTALLQKHGFKIIEF